MLKKLAQVRDSEIKLSEPIYQVQLLTRDIRTLASWLNACLKKIAKGVGGVDELTMHDFSFPLK